MLPSSALNGFTVHKGDSVTVLTALEDDGRLIVSKVLACDPAASGLDEEQEHRREQLQALGERPTAGALPSSHYVQFLQNQKLRLFTQDAWPRGMGMF